LESDDELQEFPLQSPWDINEFITENEKLPFMAHFGPDFFTSTSFLNHEQFLYNEVCENLKGNPKSSQEWTQVYGNMNKFLVGEKHLSSAKKLFKTTDLGREENKLSTKLAFWLMDKEISKRAQDIVEKQIEKAKDMNVPTELSSAAKGKLRYLAGACVQKITTRVRDSVLRKVGKTSKKTQILRKLEYKKQALLKSLRIREEDVDVQDASMKEIEAKQGPTRGLTIVSDQLFHFFILLNETVQKNITGEHFHLYREELHNRVRACVDSETSLIEAWISLFHNTCIEQFEEVEDEIFMTLIMELYRDVTEYFIRIAYVEALRNFKRTVPRKKKEALRSKVTALGDRETSSSKKPKIDIPETEQQLFECSVCKKECEWEPSKKELESIACDKCNCWFHYKCVKLKGTEAFLLKKNSTWFCGGCSKKGKGKGKGKKSAAKK
jgi:hypothetical protein